MDRYYSKPKDHEDLQKADELIQEGRAIRNRVMNRIRQRRWKAKHGESQ